MPELPAPLRLRAMITGYWDSMCVYAVAKLTLADHLANGAPRRAGELATVTGVQEGPLYRLLRAVASLGIVAEDAQGRFTLTPLGEGLRRDVPGSQWAM